MNSDTSENDISDEAMERVLQGYGTHKRHQGTSHAFRDGWREAVRRAQAQIYEKVSAITRIAQHEHEAHEQEKRAAFDYAWEAVSTYAGAQGWHDPAIDPDMARDEAFRAYQERAKEAGK